MKDLQQIKNEVFEHPMFTIHEDIDWVVDQVAIRYANEQNRELVDMLKEFVNNYENEDIDNFIMVNSVDKAKELIKTATQRN